MSFGVSIFLIILFIKPRYLMLAKQWGAAMIVVVVSAQRGAVNLNAFDELYGPDAQRERAADPYAAAFDDVDRPEVPSLDVLMGAT